MFDLIYYNERGEVKDVSFDYIPEKNIFVAIPQENYFIKGFTIKYNYLTSYQIQKYLGEDLTPLESHFLTTRYGFFPELTGYMYRNEFEPYIITATPELIELFKRKFNG